MVASSVVASQISKRMKEVGPLNFARYDRYIFAAMSTRIALVMAQFVLIANGISRLVEM